MGSAILVVDDFPENLTLIAEILAEMDVELVMAFSGAEALTVLEQREFALILLDAYMPDMDGFEVLRIKSQKKSNQYVPVIILTAVHADTHHIAIGYDLGAVDYIIKPLQPEILRSKVKVFLDLHHQKAMIQEQALVLELQKKALESAKQQVESASMAKDLFLANMSHELRTPMNTIIGMIDVLLAMDLEPEQKKFLETILYSSESLLNILNDLLDYSKIETGALNLACTLFSVRDVVDQACKLWVSVAKEKGLEFLWRVEEQTPDFLLGDPARLRQVLVNLLNNAIKFTDHGWVRLNVATGSIPQTSAEDTITIEFIVQDSGIGIPCDKLEQVFSRFFQVDVSMTRRFGGTGLGLAICEGLVHLMKGTITVTSEAGVGSAFTLQIPFVCHLVTASQDFIEPSATLHKVLRILLVEDDLDSLLMAKHHLITAGYSVTIANDGDHAMKLLTEPFDLLIMDIKMPHLSGLVTAQKIRANPQTIDPDMPIVGISMQAEESCFQDNSTGMDAFLFKPYRPDELLGLVARTESMRDLRAKKPLF